MPVPGGHGTVARTGQNDPSRKGISLWRSGRLHSCNKRRSANCGRSHPSMHDGSKSSAIGMTHRSELLAPAENRNDGTRNGAAGLSDPVAQGASERLRRRAPPTGKRVSRAAPGVANRRARWLTNVPLPKWGVLVSVVSVGGGNIAASRDTPTADTFGDLTRRPFGHLGGVRVIAVNPLPLSI